MTPPKPRPQVEFRANEEWIELAGHPRYLISTHGRIYSTISRKILRPFWVDHGHAASGGSWCGQVYVERKGRTITLAYSVLESFLGRPSGDWVVEYVDGDRGNYRLDNLRWAPRNRPELTHEHMVELARRGFAASPAAQANAGNVANLQRRPG